MGTKTDIEWADQTWNPLVGCSRISAGCKFCYAALDAASPRLQQFEQYQEVKNWDGTTAFVPSQLDKLPKKASKKIFVGSMTDIWHESHKQEWLEQVFAVMAKYPQNHYLTVTKRIKNALDKQHLWQNIPNFWFGVTVENQQAVDERLPWLEDIEGAKIKFLSVEPLLEKIDFGGYLEYVDWVIIGGESGYMSRPCDLKWIRHTIDQCKEYGAKVFIKQLGHYPVYEGEKILKGLDLYFKQGDKFNDFESFPPGFDDLKIREFPL